MRKLTAGREHECTHGADDRCCTQVRSRVFCYQFLPVRVLTLILFLDEDAVRVNNVRYTVCPALVVVGRSGIHWDVAGTPGIPEPNGQRSESLTSIPAVSYSHEHAGGDTNQVVVVNKLRVVATRVGEIGVIERRERVEAKSDGPVGADDSDEFTIRRLNPCHPVEDGKVGEHVRWEKVVAHSQT